MHSSAFFPADFKLLIECAWHQRNNIAARHAEALSRLIRTLSDEQLITSLSPLTAPGPAMIAP
jgi:hypothetical protein